MRILEGFEGHDVYLPGETKEMRTAPRPINQVGGRALDGYMNPAELAVLDQLFPTYGPTTEVNLVIGEGRDLIQPPMDTVFRGDADSYSTLRAA